MRPTLLFMLLMSGSFGRLAQSHEAISQDGLRVELRTDSNRVKLTDDPS